MSDYNVKECPCEACKKARAAEQPPAGDVMERMCSDYGNLTGTDPDPVAMAAALAVARECYVSLEDVKEAVQRAYVYAISIDGSADFWREVEARLSKPVEQTDEQAIKLVLDHHSPEEYHEEHNRKQIAAEILAALRDGKEGK